MKIQQFVIQLLITWAMSALALILTAKIMPGIKLRGTATAFLAAFVLGALNATIFRVLWVLSLPFTIITLGLFLLFLNGAMLKLTARFVDGFRVEGWFSAIVGSIVLSLTQGVLYFFYRRILE